MISSNYSHLIITIYAQLYGFRHLSMFDNNKKKKNEVTPDR